MSPHLGSSLSFMKVEASCAWSGVALDFICGKKSIGGAPYEVAAGCLGTTCRKCTRSPDLYRFSSAHCNAFSLSAPAVTVTKIFLAEDEALAPCLEVVITDHELQVNAVGVLAGPGR